MKKKSKKIEIDVEISKLTKSLNVIKKSYCVNCSVFSVFENIPIELRIDKSVEKGRKVMTSYYPESHDVYLVEYHNIGEPSYPYGGIKVYNRSMDEYKILYPEAVVKHKNVEYYNKNLE